MDSSDIKSLEIFRSKDTLIAARPDLEGDHLDKDEKSQRGEKKH